MGKVKNISKEETINDIIETLDECRKEDANMYGLFFLGSQLAIGSTRLYQKYGTARRRLIDYVSGWHEGEELAGQREQCIDEMIESGIIEIRKLGDRSARFPHNKMEDKEMATKLAAMLDAPDEELSKMAINILQNMKK
jgi:hypothetical protein